MARDILVSLSLLHQSIIFFLWLLVLLLFPPLSQTFITLFLLESRHRFVNYLESHFCVSQPNALHSRARVYRYLLDLSRVSCPEESHSSFWSPLTCCEFLVPAISLSSFTATDPDRVAYLMRSTSLALA